MADSYFATSGQPGDLRISITTDNELRYWMRAFNCTEAKLLEAMSIVGPMQLAVRKYLVYNP